MAMNYSASKLLSNIFDPGHFQDSGSGFEQNWELPEEIGKGSMHRIKLRPGLFIGTGQFLLFDEISVGFHFDCLPIVIACSISGSMLCTLEFKRNCKKLWKFQQGHSLMSYLPMCHGLCQLPSNTPIECVIVYVNPVLLNSYMAGQYDQMPPGLFEFASGTLKNYFHQSSIMSPSTKGIALQILSCQYIGGLKWIYLESKALELITSILVQFIPWEITLKKKYTLRPDDIERVHHARELIERDIQKPPTLKEIANIVGLSHSKLNFLYREVYGSTIFAHLRELRLNKSRLLLNEGTMNVTEVAFEVGYSNLSYFAKAFKDNFGIAPGIYLRKAKVQSAVPIQSFK